MSEFVGTVPLSYKKKIYLAVVSQKLRNTGLNSWVQWPYVGLQLLDCYDCSWSHAEGMDVHLLCWLCVVQWADHSFRGNRPGVCVCVSNGVWELATSKRGRLPNLGY